MRELWNAFDRWAFGTQLYACASRYDLDGSLERLSQAIKTKKVLGINWSSGIIGRVSPDFIEAYVQSYAYHNSFKPIFRGQLQTIDGKVMLVGSFSLFPIVKITTLLFLGVWLAAGVTALVQHQADPWFLLIGPAFIALLVAFGRLLSRSELRTVSQALDAALMT